MVLSLSEKEYSCEIWNPQREGEGELTESYLIRLTKEQKDWLEEEARALCVPQRSVLMMYMYLGARIPEGIRRACSMQEIIGM